MKAIFGKWSPLFLALLIFQVIIILIVVIWTFEDNSSFLKSIYDFIANSPVAIDILDFIVNYADIISGVVICIALVILLVSLRKYHRGRAINRLHNWARSGVVVLSRYRQEKTGAGNVRAYGYEDVRVMVDKLIASSNIALADARYLRGEINDKTKSAVEILRIVRKKLADEDESVFENLRDLQHDFADVMILAFELIK